MLSICLLRKFNKILQLPVQISKMHANVISIFLLIRNNSIFSATKKQKSENAPETFDMHCGEFYF